jgi:hypothetical protein
MSMLVYLIQVNLALVSCWALYRLAFRELSFFQWNRFYLMGSVVLSLFLPMLRLPGNSPMGVADMGAIDWSYVDHLASAPVALTPYAEGWSPRWLFWIVYGTVALVFLIRSGWKLRHLFRNLGSSRRIVKGRVKVYVQDHRMGSFTLFRRIYLDRHFYENQSPFVLRHEMAHAVQLHSLDLLFMEFLTAMLWFNPLVFVLLRYVRENHEYLADRYAHGDRNSLAEYLECLKAETIREFAPVPASHFKSTTIKKRIIMLTNHSSSKRNLWRYLGIIPVAAVLLVLFHTPATQGKALKAHVPEIWMDNPVPLIMEETIPSIFPLPETYKQKITWGYHKKARHPITQELTLHQGIDVAAPTGTPVSATGEGVVRKAAHEKGWGKLVVIEHGGGFTTFYAHLDEMSVEKGMKVAVGQVIGKVGNTGQSTGPHLHYEVRKNGEQVNPADYY